VSTGRPGTTVDDGTVDRLTGQLADALARLRRLEHAEAARNLLHAYAETLDDPTPERVAALFAEDGVLAVPSATFRGRAEVEAFYRSRLTPEDGDKRHFLVNLRTRHVADGVVEVASYFVFTGRHPDRSALGWGTYLDRIRIVDGEAGPQAYFEHKTITPHLATDLASGWPSAPTTAG
jgi:uncharacterized protein (TIGR02246 family)